MVKVAKDAAERTFQENFVSELKKYKWSAPDFLNGNKQRVTVDDLINNWRKELNRINADQLEGVKLTDSEFQQVLAKVNNIDNSYEAAKILAIEDGKGKIDGIYRDDNPNITKKQITLTIFKKAEVRGGDSSYQVAREVETAKGNRFDIVLLINGLPLINIEQKRTDKDLNEAFGQFQRYYRDGEYTNNFMAFSQMMVITSEVKTRYFATPKSIDDFNPSFVFNWSDKNNTPVNDWRKIIESFLMIPMAHQMVGDYLVIDEARNAENRRHMLLRPYQVYALQAVESAAFGWDTPEKIPHGGFVWHTTGSGKTITSFKTALFLSTRGGFDKVVFLVDRRELDQKTAENFKAYAQYEPVQVDDTQHTYQLKKILRTTGNGIVVTTTFKLNNLVSELVENQDDSLSDKKIVFIIDEAHRTTMGQMMGNITSYFHKNGLFYGFTGTPLYDENHVKGKVNAKSEVINTTEKLFGPELHSYTIDEAIADRNVLGFHVDYINTGEFKSYDDLRNQLIEKLKDEHPDLTDREIEREVQGYSEVDLEKEGLFEYQDTTHIPVVVKEILENWDTQSNKKEFNAILTVALKSRVIAYYEEFKRQLEDSDQSLNIAMTFSFGNENDPNNTVDPAVVKMMFEDYEHFTGIEFIANDKKHGEEAYFEDLVDRSTRGGSGLNPKNIDLIIVADQLLTGYDSKRLNTLYVDRSLELQGLIQAYSRTNRVYGASKEFGTIVNFKYPRVTEENVNMALQLYGKGGNSSKVIVDVYDNAVQKLNLAINEMVETLPVPTDWQLLVGDEKQKNLFVESFKEAAKQFNAVEQYYEYSWNDKTFGMDEHTWLQYVGAYRNLTDDGDEPNPPEVTNVLVGAAKLAGTQVIDANHILKLIGSKVNLDDGTQSVDTETLRIIYEQIQELSNMGDHDQAELLRDFVDTELVPQNIPSNIDFDVAFEDWKKSKLNNEIQAFADEWGIDFKILQLSVKDYSVLTPENTPYLSDITNSVDFNKASNQSAGTRLKHIMTLTRLLPEWMAEISQRYQ